MIHKRSRDADQTNAAEEPVPTPVQVIDAGGRVSRKSALKCMSRLQEAGDKARSVAFGFL